MTMPDRLTDERLEPQIARIRAAIERIRQHEPAMADSLTRLLDAVTDRVAGLVALRRVAEAAEVLFDLLYHGHASLTEDADRAAQRMRMALAEWRRVRGGRGRS